MLRKILAFSLIMQISGISLTFASPNSVTGLSLSDDLEGVGLRGNEFYSSAGKNAVLMRVNLWGAVQKSGIHHVPTKTDLVTLLSYAGGPLPDAELDDVTIKRRVNGKEEQVEVDLSKILASSSAKNPMLEPNDIVVIPVHRPFINRDVAATVGFIGAIASIALVTVLFSNGVK